MSISLASVRPSLCGVSTHVVYRFFASVVRFLYLVYTDRSETLNTATNNYWSSTSYAADSTNAWNVNFNNGNVNANNKTNSNYVRCVRG